MNTQKSSKKTLFIIIAIVVIAGIAYFYYQGSTPSTSSTLTQAPSAADQAIGTRVLDLLNQIRTLRIDTSIFKDPAYATLRDYSVAIPPQDVGRVNPFAPLPGVPSSGSAASSGSSASR